MNEDREVTMELHNLLGSYMKDREVDKILTELAKIMRDETDGPKLVRLFQKWLACS